MAVHYACDGCGNPVETPSRRGLVIVREYCDACTNIVDGYLTERDVVHDSISEQWARRMAALQRETVERQYGLKLPDVPSDGPDATGVAGPRGADPPEGHPAEEDPQPPAKSRRQTMIEKARAEGHDI